MILVLFESWPADGQMPRYLDLAAALRPILEGVDGFLSMERYESLTEPGKLLSLSCWRDEAAVAAWRALPVHRQAQAEGRCSVFSDYRLRIAEVVRAYGRDDREQAPADSRATHEAVSRASAPSPGSR
ncbi:antibiotic biosynthesis monooxygenase family protein [Sphingoaurantiacus capsulatus]|uniref:Antibiotic biosynthesis monooxygenase family protein n=1 Tax=Sphingoaurantiacus capsulatus TaxID=1771310 RepID=A0ABV7X7E9_9SPHN